MTTANASSRIATYTVLEGFLTIVEPDFVDLLQSDGSRKAVQISVPGITRRSTEKGEVPKVCKIISI